MLNMQPMTLTIDISRRNWLTSNMRSHWAEKARRTKELRQTARLCGRRFAIKPPVFTRREPCTVVVEISIPTPRRFDPMNASPTVKALLDGLTDAGWWDDDDSKTVKSVTYKLGKPTGVKGLYRVTVTARSIGGAQV